MKKLLSILMIFASAISSGQAMNTIKKYFGEENHLATITYPADWIARDNPKAIYIFVRPPHSPTDTSFPENINVVAGASQGFKTIETYAEDVIGRLRKYAPEINIVKESSSFATAGNLKCARMVYSYESDGKAFRVAQFQIMKDDVVYSVTCTALKTTFSKFEPLFDKVGSSLRIDEFIAY